MSETDRCGLPSCIGRYEVLEEIGRGGMGVVYKARDPNLGRLVALKVVKLAFAADADLEQEMHQRFEREAKAAAILQSPNIVTVYDFGEDQGVRYIAMEYVEGTALDDLCGPGELLPIRQVNAIVRQVAEGLAYAHERGVIHRDIKPANILCTTDGSAKIADFGIARVGDSTLTQQNVYIGSPSYMSPEQVSGQTVDARSDVFALGVVLYQLLTGERPFPGDNATVISYRIMRVEPPDPSALNPLIPPGYDVVIKKALAKRPEDRYTGARDMADDLLRLESGEKLPAVVDTQRIKKPARDWAAEIRALWDKPWARVTGLGLLALIVIVILVIVTVAFSNPYRKIADLIAAGQHDKAALALQEILRDKPKDYRAYYMLGREYAAIGNFSSSLQAYDQALALHPEYGDEPQLQGDLVNALGQPEVNQAALGVIVSRKLKSLEKRLRAELSEKDYYRHWNACQALEKMGQTVEKLPLYKMDLTYNDECKVRKTAAEEIGNLGGLDLVPDLEVAQYDKRNNRCSGMFRTLEEAIEKIKARPASEGKETTNETKTPTQP